LTNQTGTVIQRYTYSSFGKIESQLDPNFVQPFTYTARELDTETGLYYYRTRYYDYTTGRFVQTDPIRDGTNFYGYVDNNPARFTDSFGLAPIDIAANIVAGFGDSVSFGLTRHARGNDAVVDECSLSYRLGSWAGFFHGLAMGGASLLNGGAKTILWSGTGAREAAEAARNGGKLLTDTPLGRLLDVIDEVYNLPKPIWSGASRVFASNAQGEVRAFLKEPSANGIYNTVERPTIDLINKIHEAVTGSPATVVRRW
jgi:RHS repeat-associated protein